MPRLTIHTGIDERDVEISPQESLLHALQRSGVSISFPCAGNHTCGKCRVRAQGALSDLKEEERALLKDAEEGIRLACFTRAEGDCAVYLPGGGRDTIASNYAADSEAIRPVYQGGFGAAFDIGTTTVVGYLFHENVNEPLAVLGELNRQQPYGSNVLSRIDYCNTHTVEPLCALIRGQLADMLRGLCQRADVPADEIRAIVATGNTAMMHILAGLEPGSLALAPFTPQSLFDCWLDLELNGFAGVQTYIPPCISSYVGADITCSILYSGITRKEENLLLVDIGTNGEMALQTPKCMVCCATAAGPAFEGAGISCGSNARTGAIQSVWVNNGTVGYTTVGSGAAQSICGSGLVDAAAALLALGVIDRSGRMDRQYAGAVSIGNSGVSLTQGDIRELQLAKAAIRGGMDTLLHECSLSYEALSRIILCGGFGSSIQPRSAAEIGLIPYAMGGRTLAIGNAAGIGAGYILQSVDRLEEARSIAQRAQTVELATHPFFLERFIEVMAFGEQLEEDD
jgi:uncharacterized 2Fe-2S/4Fe-4S cluster protein (DUF4445 family)